MSVNLFVKEPLVDIIVNMVDMIFSYTETFAEVLSLLYELNHWNISNWKSSSMILTTVLFKCFYKKF